MVGDMTSDVQISENKGIIGPCKINLQNIQHRKKLTNNICKMVDSGPKHEFCIVLHANGLQNALKHCQHHFGSYEQNKRFYFETIFATSVP
jgi:hypothetical protein